MLQLPAGRPMANTAALFFLLFIMCFRAEGQQLPRPADGTMRSGSAADSVRGEHFLYLTPEQQQHQRLPYPFQVPTVTDAAASARKSQRITGDITIDLQLSQPTCGYASGAAVITATGGTPPYTYAIQSYGIWSVYNTGNIPVLSAGDYLLRVTDAAGLSAETNFSLTNLFPPVKLELDAFTPTSSCSTATGSITVKASDGKAPYQYTWDLINYTDNPVFTGLSLGYYDIFVKDANGCIGNYNSFGLLGRFGCTFTAGLRVGGYACGSNGLLSMEALGEGGPFTYSLDGVNYQDVGDWEGLPPGAYTIWTKDASGKIYLFSSFKAEWCDIAVTYIAVDAACEGTDGSLTITAENGIEPYTYTIDGINYQSSNVFSNLRPGPYIVTARDFNGIKSSVTADVYDKCPRLDIAVTDESCAGNDGVIELSGYKGTEPYQYAINGGSFASQARFNDLSEGVYTLAVKDALGFTREEEVYLAKGCLYVTAAAEDAGCTGGKISVYNSGASPYQYAINDGAFQSQSVFENLAAGMYTITVKDAAGNIGTARAEVHAGTIISPQISIQSPTCAGNDGVLTVTASGGKAPYTFSVNNGTYHNNGSFSGLAPGNYTIRVKDAAGCIIEKDTVIAATCLIFNTETKTPDCGYDNGSITVDITSGKAPFQFSIDGLSFSGDNKFPNLSPGNYAITVSADDGSRETVLVTLEEGCLRLELAIKNAVCGLATGSATVTTTGGTAPYQYSLNGSAFQNSYVMNDLVSGDYTLAVKDAQGQVLDTTFRVAERDPPEITLTTKAAGCENNDGELLIAVSGGTAPLAFSLNGYDFQENNRFTNLAAGSYTAYATDAAGCKLTAQAAITVHSNLYLDMGADTTICEGESMILRVASNATQYAWNTDPSLSSVSIKNPVASPPSSTTYRVTATYGSCEITGSMHVAVRPAPVAAVSPNETVCLGQDARLTGSGGTTYHWSPATWLSNADIADPVVQRPEASITYELLVTDADGCISAPAAVTVTVTPSPLLFAGNDTAIVTGKDLQLTAIDVNNSGFVSYNWSPSIGLTDHSIASPVLVNAVQNVMYTVTAYTDAGCKAVDQIHITVYKKSEIYVADVFTPNGDGVNDVLHAVPVGISKLHYFIIFDRWGRQVFSTSRPEDGWNGMINGMPLPSGVFVWKAGGTDMQGNALTRKGTVMLIQ